MTIPSFGGDVDRDLGTALKAASAGGTIIRAGWKKTKDFRIKGIGDFVTTVDTEADHAITKVVRMRCPDDVIISEELSPDHPDTMRRTWIVDPMDATTAFIFQAGSGLPSVLVALRKKGETRIGVCYFPLTDELFYAIRGRGAYKGPHQLFTDQSVRLCDAWVDMNHYGDGDSETDAFARLERKLRSERQPRLLTSLPPHSGLAVRIAEGVQKVSAVIHDNGSAKVKQAPWDTAAVQLILEEAGGEFLNFRGEQYDPFKPEPIVAACNLHLAHEIIALAA